MTDGVCSNLKLFGQLGSDGEHKRAGRQVRRSNDFV